MNLIWPIHNARTLYWYTPSLQVYLNRTLKLPLKAEPWQEQLKTKRTSISGTGNNSLSAIKELVSVFWQIHNTGTLLIHPQSPIVSQHILELPLKASIGKEQFKTREGIGIGKGSQQLDNILSDGYYGTKLENFIILQY